MYGNKTTTKKYNENTQKSSIIDTRIKNGYKNANVHVDSVAKKKVCAL